MYKGHSKSSIIIFRTHKELEKQDSFSLFFKIVLFDINALSPTMDKHFNPIREEGGILVLQNTTHMASLLFLKW